MIAMRDIKKVEFKEIVKCKHKDMFRGSSTKPYISAFITKDFYSLHKGYKPKPLYKRRHKANAQSQQSPHKRWAQSQLLSTRRKHKAKVQNQRENKGTTLSDHKDHKQYLSQYD